MISPVDVGYRNPDQKRKPAAPVTTVSRIWCSPTGSRRRLSRASRSVRNALPVPGVRITGISGGKSVDYGQEVTRRAFRRQRLPVRTKPVVMEVNSSPGLEGIENASGKDVAGMIMDFIERNARPNRTRTRGKG